MRKIRKKTLVANKPVVKKHFTNYLNSDNFTMPYFAEDGGVSIDCVTVHVNAMSEGSKVEIIINVFGIDREAYKNGCFKPNVVSGNCMVRLSLMGSYDPKEDPHQFHQYTFELQSPTGVIALDFSNQETKLVRWEVKPEGTLIEHELGSVYMTPNGVKLADPASTLESLEDQLQYMPEFLTGHIQKQIARVKAEYKL